MVAVTSTAKAEEGAVRLASTFSTSVWRSVCAPLTRADGAPSCYTYPNYVACPCLPQHATACIDLKQLDPKAREVLSALDIDGDGILEIGTSRGRHGAALGPGQRSGRDVALFNVPPRATPPAHQTARPPAHGAAGEMTQVRAP